MIKDQQLFDKLYKAAEKIYNYIDPENGFPAGTTRNEETGRTIRLYNIMSGSKQSLEHRLGRKLTNYEEAVLAIAIGNLNNKALKSLLSSQELEEISQDLWGDKRNTEHECLTFERLVTTM